MKNLPTKMKCKFCGDSADLIKYVFGDKEYSYYYHYSKDYKLGCCQRISLDNKARIKTLTTWTKDDEIRDLTEKINELSVARYFYRNLNVKSIKYPKLIKLIKWWVTK